MSEAVRTIDLNADAGEGFDSLELFRWISSASIACGGHAGDAETMGAALRLARDCGVAVGAHPGYEDRERFGRAETGQAAGTLREMLRRQVGMLIEVAAGAGVRIAYVKPHGALYHRLSRDAEAAGEVVTGLAELDSGLAIVGFPGSELLAAARGAGLAALGEGFVDRRYAVDGTLVPRTEEGSLLGSEEALAQAVALASGDPVAAARRAPSRAGVSTLCLHSDSPGAAALARAARQALEAAGLTVAPFAPAERVPAIAELHVVGAAIVEAGRVLLARRGPGMSMPGKWEFPGGKLEPGEAPEAALAREVAEELALEIEVGAPLGRGTGLVAGRRIRLDVRLARRSGRGEPRLGEHDKLGWFVAGELRALDWPEADLPVLPALVRALEASASGG